MKREEKRISVYCELTFCFIDLSSFSHIDVYINKRLKRRHALLFHYLFHFNCTLSFPCHRCQSFFEINSYKFRASTKLNRFHSGLNTVRGWKSHQFCILFSESIYNFWLVILLVRFFLRVFFCVCECLPVCLFVIVQYCWRRRRRPRFHFNSYFCGWLHPEEDKTNSKRKRNPNGNNSSNNKKWKETESSGIRHFFSSRLFFTVVFIWFAWPPYSRFLPSLTLLSAHTNQSQTESPIFFS